MFEIMFLWFMITKFSAWCTVPKVVTATTAASKSIDNLLEKTKVAIK